MQLHNFLRRFYWRLSYCMCLLCTTTNLANAQTLDEFLTIQKPVTIEEIRYHLDGGTIGMIIKDRTGKEFRFCHDARIRRYFKETKSFEKDYEHPYHKVYIGAVHTLDKNAQVVQFDSEHVKLILDIVEDWVNRNVSTADRKRLNKMQSVVGMSDDEIRVFRIFRFIYRVKTEMRTGNSDR